jgi:branched-subunit amino acid aminotransferase/4-amino-4-deoxychorismate lyase
MPTPLVEGLVNNLFVITQAGPQDPPVLRTASVQQGALPGVLRVAVLATCKALGYAFVEDATAPPPAPDTQARDGNDTWHTWREAFLCNAVRLIQPVGQMRWLPPAERPPLDFPEAPGPVTRALAAHVAAEAAREDMSPRMVPTG